ncbi:unnamed protein product [Cyprideis torosa]|uniref:S-adenosylmethionine decarboxylase proenzyme n=1 Tax=Cyprideis torosa TaxID=163714 RepID=A0A7R8VZZ8_9CRUS|nr:unnamed protein product [Cyprideis torosa]CAG0879225.1 unnamed protein product [Cyprideis torosa]
MGTSDDFYEGTEKLLELWFTRQDGNSDGCDLRKIPRSVLDSLLQLVRCEIVSECSNADIDAYVLSESSMFISKRRFILKTCGSTALMVCIKPLLAAAAEFAGFDRVEDIFYSRKNFARPDLQPQPHHDFSAEVDSLDRLFKDGAAYCLGQMNRDCWYLYTISPSVRPFWGNGLNAIEEPDQTLEIMMMELNPERMKFFTKEGSLSARDATEKSGISKILDGVTIDDVLFEPCGYSMNGILKNGCYMTIHITPESNYSYVSFESNIPMRSYHEVLVKVLRCFEPGKFIMTVFANEGSITLNSHSALDGSKDILDYHRVDLQSCRFRNYHLTYAHYARFPS